MQVDYGPDAKAELRALGKVTAGFLELELKSLLVTRDFPDDFVLLRVRHDPPWWWVRLNRAYAAAVRIASQAELAAKLDLGPRLVVGAIVPAEEDLHTVERRLIENPDDVQEEDGGEGDE